MIAFRNTFANFCNFIINKYAAFFDPFFCLSSGSKSGTCEYFSSVVGESWVWVQDVPGNASSKGIFSQS